MARLIVEDTMKEQTMNQDIELLSVALKNKDEDMKIQPQRRRRKMRNWKNICNGKKKKKKDENLKIQSQRRRSKTVGERHKDTTKWEI